MLRCHRPDLGFFAARPPPYYAAEGCQGMILVIFLISGGVRVGQLWAEPCSFVAASESPRVERGPGGVPRGPWVIQEPFFDICSS